MAEVVAEVVLEECGYEEIAVVEAVVETELYSDLLVSDLGQALRL